MSQAEGARSQLIFLEESAYGVTPGTTNNTRGIRFVSETLQNSQNTFESQEIRSDRMVQSIKQGNASIAGDITCELNPEGLEILFKHLLGEPTSTTGSGPYDHVIKGTPTLPVGLLIEKGFTDINQYFLYNGIRLNQGAFSFPQEGLIQVVLGAIGRQETISSSSIDATPTYSSTEPFVSFEAAIYQDGSGSPLGTVTQLNFTIANNLRDQQFVIGSRYRYNLPAGKRRVTGNFTAFFEDVTTYNKFLNNTTVALRVRVTDATSGLWVEFEFPKVKLAGQSPTPNIPDDGPVVNTYAFQTFRDTVTNTDVICRIHNGVASLVAND